MMLSRGKVPNFTLRPHPVITGIFFMVLVMGILGALALLSQEDGSGRFRQQGILVLVITGVICALLAILATSKFWFRHLWKKNSTHKRHHQHSKHHPVNRSRPSSR